jgi:hypothetical protein
MGSLFRARYVRKFSSKSFSVGFEVNMDLYRYTETRSLTTCACYSWNSRSSTIEQRFAHHMNVPAGLVLAIEKYSDEAIPLCEVHGRRGVAKLDAHYTRLHLNSSELNACTPRLNGRCGECCTSKDMRTYFWRRPKIVLPHFHELVDFRQQLLRINMLYAICNTKIGFIHLKRTSCMRARTHLCVN